MSGRCNLIKLFKNLVKFYSVVPTINKIGKEVHLDLHSMFNICRLLIFVITFKYTRIIAIWIDSISACSLD